MNPFNNYPPSSSTSPSLLSRSENDKFSNQIDLTINRQHIPIIFNDSQHQPQKNYAVASYFGQYLLPYPQDSHQLPLVQHSSAMAKKDPHISSNGFTFGPNFHFDSVGTIVLPCGEIQDVTMIDDCDLPYDSENVSFLALDHRLNESNVFNPDYEQEYWKNTRDCDYRFLPTTVINKINTNNNEPEFHGLSLVGNKNRSKFDQNHHSKHLSRKKRKKLRQVEEINLSKKSNAVADENSVDLTDIDKLEVDDLISYYNKLKKELTILNVENNQHEDNSNNHESETVADDVPIDLEKETKFFEEFDQISDNDDEGDVSTNVKNGQTINDDLPNVNIIQDIELTSDSNSNSNLMIATLKKERTGKSPKENKEITKEILPISSRDDISSKAMKENGNGSNNSLMNENLLREQLIRTLLEKRISKANQQGKPKQNIEMDLNSSNDNINMNKIPPTQFRTTTIDQSKNISKENLLIKPEIDLSHFKLIIHISDDSESESGSGDDVDDNHANEDSDHSDTSHDSSIIKQNLNNSLPYINKLSKSQQKEYQKLKREIERREYQRYNLKTLQSYELKLKHTLLGMEQKKKSIMGLNRKFTNLKKKFKKSQNRVQKLKRLYLISQKSLKLHSVQMQLVMKELKSFKKSLIEDNETIKQYRNLCSSVGRKLYGQQYSLPDIQTLMDNTKKKILESHDKYLSKHHLASGIVVSKKNNSNKKQERIQSLRYLRNKIQLLLKTSYVFDNNTIMLLSDCVNFNFKIFESSRFFQSAAALIPFSDFTENSSELLDARMLNQNRTINIEDIFNGNYQSVLMHFNSYRFQSDPNLNISSDFWSNSLNPNEIICHYDLMGSCNDVKCCFQHQKDYIYSSQEKILDILTYSHKFANEITNIEELKKNPKVLQEKLDVYLKDKQFKMSEHSLETICSHLGDEIRKNDSKISVTSLLIRLFPKELVKLCEKRSSSSSSSKSKVPFEDYSYRFDVRDDLFDMKLSQLVNLTLENDPDSYIKNRFFAPEGVPITAQLESSLSSDPNNIQMWINLAYCHLSKIFNQPQDDLEYCFDSALNVLSRALEYNRNNSELYEHYLLFYVNKSEHLMVRGQSISKSINDRTTLIDIQEICRRILKYCSTYRLWICYLNLCYAIEEKYSISMEILEHYVQDQIQYSSDEERSFNLLEIIFYRINLLLHQNKHEESVKFFNDIFNSSLETGNSKLCSLILRKHRAFAWHCYIYLILYRCLPYHCFQLTKRACFLQLINTEPFIFDWKTNTSENDLRITKKIFKRALKNCCSDDILKCSCDQEGNPMDTCFSLRLNLTNLNKILIQNITRPHHDEDDDLENSYYLSFLFNENCQVLSNLHILHMFEINLGLETNGKSDLSLASCEMLNLIENFYNSNKSNQDRLVNYQLEGTNDELLQVLQSQLKFNYWLAFYHLKLRNLNKSKETLQKNLTYYFQNTPEVMDENSRNDHFLKLYEIILFDSPMVADSAYSNDSFKSDLISSFIKSKLKFQKQDKRAHHLVYLYLSYMLYTHICIKENSDYDPDQHHLKLDCIFSSVINSFSSRNPQAYQDGLAKILWFNYFLLLLDFPYSDSHFKIIYENLRHICLNFQQSDPIFIFHLVNTISKFINTPDRLYFLVDLCKLNPENINLVMKVFNMALEQQKKETLWNLITYVVYEKRIRLQCLEFWKIAISLSVERNDHLNTHKFFQIAVSLMPYNMILWEMFKNYETSINHQEHLNQMKLFYIETLHMMSPTTLSINTSATNDDTLANSV